MYCFSRLLSGRTILAIVFVAAVAVLPASAQEEGEDIQTADYDVQNLTYPDLRDFETPEPTRLELENGMTVFLLEDHELPQVNAVARIGVGSVYEPAEKRGLASVTGQVMRTGGTESMSPDSVNIVLENVGASVETSIGQTSGSVSMSTLTENIDTVLPVFADVLREPAFAKAKVQQAKSRLKSSISRRNDNARQIASREFNQLLYGEDSPYARTAEYYTIDRITQQDLADFHEQYVQPNNIILSVWGDFDTSEMEEKVRDQFGDWTAPEDFDPPTPPERSGSREYSVNFIQKSDVNQSTVFMGHPGEITRRSDDYAAVTIMNEVLSGGFSGRLFQNVRKEKGLAYSVLGAYTTGYSQPGRFYAGVFSKSPTTVEATNAVMTEVKRMRQEAPTAEELSLAKDSYLNSFVFNFDTEREILSRLMTYEYYDYPSDFLQQTKDEIEQVGAQDVLSVAKEYLYPNQSHILVVGNREAFSDSLESLTRGGSVNEIDIAIPQEPPETEAAAPTASDKKATAAGRKLMASVKEALGGSAFDEVTNMRIVTKRQGNTSRLVVDLPNQIRTELTTPMGKITVVDDGETMKMKTPQGTRTAPPSARQQVAGQLWKSLPYLMTNLDHDDLSFRAEGDTTVSGTPYEVLRVDPPAGSAFTLHVNAETLRPERMAYEMMGRSGQAVSVSQTFRDYRQVHGLTLPFTTETVQSTAQQEQTITGTIESLEVNVSLEEGMFTLNDASSDE